MTKIITVAEVKNGEVKKPTFELLAFAKSQGFDADAVLIGHQMEGQAEVLSGHGAGKVYQADDPALAIYNNAQYTSLVVEAAGKSGASQIWLTSSEMGRDLTPRVAARLDVGALSDITSMEIDGNEITAMRPCMATKLMQKCRFTRESIRVVSIRAGSYEANEAAGAPADVVPLGIPAGDSRVRALDIQVEESDEVELNEADIVVTIGRGAGGTEGCEFVRPLARQMGAAFGASRAVCDAGWLPHKHQVGQTGTAVTPEFYFAFGISGAIQHLAGMSGSKVIVAVNKDAEAPIFKVADYGIVGDLFKAVPVLREEMEKLKG